MVMIVDIGDKVKIISKMQDYIEANIEKSDFCAENVSEHFFYSIRHLNRLFKEFFGKTVCEYINALKLTKSAENIDGYKTILDAALECGYQTHEGYTKAFGRMFGTSPSDYKNKNFMIPLYISYPVMHSYNHYYKKGESKLNKKTIVCTAYLVKKPARKLIMLRSKDAVDYFTFCAENRCDWEGYLNSNHQKLDTAAILTLPEILVKKGTSKIAAGIEVPVDCDTANLLDGYEVEELDACEMMYFKSESFDDKDDYSSYIDAVNKAFEEFDFHSIGYMVDLQSAPCMNFGAQAQAGARIAYPVRKI